MGEVYRARDPRLGRDVAIKVVLAAFAADSDRVRRFEQEARAAAALNHPNILAVYDIGQHDPSAASTLREPQGRPEQGRGTTSSGQAGSGQAVPYIVSELLEGDTLRERLSAGALPVRKGLDYAIQIARGLAAAHEKGIVHRDLKPENVFVTMDGRVKILDFGLAKLIEADPAVAEMSTLATVPPQTLAGLVLGTVGYMSPEQARGLPADHRADIFAFGAVLYEMLSGRRAFQRDTGADTMIAIVRDEPPDLPVTDRQIPPALQRLVSRCLEKSPAARFQSASDMAFALDALSASDTTRSGVVADQLPAARVQVRWTRAIPWAVATVATVLAVFAIITASRRGTPAEKTVTRLELNLPKGVELFSNGGIAVTVSPDGTAVAFVGMLAAVRQMYLRRLDQTEANLVRLTDLASSVFISPDGLSMGTVLTDGTVKRMSLKDGLLATVTVGVNYAAGATWSADDQIVFTHDETLWRVPVSLGTSKQLTKLDQGRHEVAHRWPVVLPGNQAIVFSSYTAGIVDGRIEAVSLPAGTRRIVVDRGVPVAYTSTGHLIFFRDSALLAAAFDPIRLELTGAPVRVTEAVASSSSGAPQAAVSPSGTLVYAPAGVAMAQLVLVSRQGLEQSLSEMPPGNYANPRVSPDGRRIVVGKSSEGLWLYDGARRVSTRLTFGESNTTYPVWTPDGQRVVYRTASGLRWIQADGSGRGGAIPGTSFQDIPNSVSPDGETLAFLRISAETSGDVYVLSLKGDPNPRAMVKTAAYEGGPQFSPDGRWLAYTSNESGQSQVYVRRYPAPDQRWQVSTQGGTHVQWSKAGKEIFYRQANKMMAVLISDGSSNQDPALSTPKVLFEQRYSFGGSTTTANYDLSADDQQFVMVKEESGTGHLNVVLNWFEELKARVPVK